MSEKRYTDNIQSDLEVALTHHSAGRLSEAEDIYRQILKTSPKHPVALHLLGVKSHQVGRNDIAIKLINKAIAEEPNYAEAHNNLGLALHAANRPKEAIKSYHRALTIRSGYADAYNNLGNSLQLIGRLADAISNYRKALQVNPKYALALNNLGNALQELGHFEKAVTSYKESLQLNPHYAVAHNNLGNALRSLGRLDEAVISYRKGLDLDETSTKLHSNLGEALRDIAYLKTQTRQITNPDQIDSTGSFDHSKEGKLWDDVRQCAECALDITPHDTQALALKAAALIGTNQLDEWNSLCDFNRLVQTHMIESPSGHKSTKSFNNALFDRCATDDSRIFEAPGKAITKGERIDSLHTDPADSPVTMLLTKIDELTELYTKTHPTDPQHPFLVQTPRKWRISAWGSILRKEGHHESHIHKVGWLSGVYYGKLPAVMENETQNSQGCIEFGRPINYVDSGNNPKFHILRPKEGMVVLFPAYFYHRTIPFETDDTRFTIAFDLIALP